MIIYSSKAICSAFLTTVRKIDFTPICYMNLNYLQLLKSMNEKINE